MLETGKRLKNKSNMEENFYSLAYGGSDYKRDILYFKANSIEDSVKEKLFD